MFSCCYQHPAALCSKASPPLPLFLLTPSSWLRATSGRGHHQHSHKQVVATTASESHVNKFKAEVWSRFGDSTHILRWGGKNSWFRGSSGRFWKFFFPSHHMILQALRLTGRTVITEILSAFREVRKMFYSGREDFFFSLIIYLTIHFLSALVLH